MKKILNNKTICIVVLLCLIFLRFWKVPELFYFGIDEEYQSLLALSIIKDFHVIWIGLSAANTGFYIGPGLVYFHSMLLWLSKGDPIILAYAGSFIGIVTLVIFYCVVKNLFSRKIAFLSSTLYALSSFVISYDRRFWNSTLVPLTVILFYYSLVKLKKNPGWIIFIAFLIGLSFHIHASLFIFIPIVLITMFRNIEIKKIKMGKWSILISAVVFLIVYSPLIVFDLVHNFDNLKTPLRMLKTVGQGGGGRVVANINTFQLALARFWLNIDQSVLLSFVLFLLSVFILIKFVLKKKNYQEQILSTVIFCYLIMFIFYPGKVLDYYYLGFLPFFALLSGLLLQKINRYLLVIFIAVFTVINSLIIFDLSINRGLTNKRELINKTLAVVGNRSFSLDTNQKYLYFGGWRYLFEAYGRRPSQSQADEMFGWIYPKEISQEKPQLKVIVSDNEISTKEKPFSIIKSGIYQAYVFENN